MLDTPHDTPSKPKRDYKRRGQPDYPTCPVCDKRDNVRRNGNAHGKPQFFCVPCHRYFHPDIDRTPPPIYPCPYCQAPCRKYSITPKGYQRYHCRACNRTNTALWPEPRRPRIGQDYRQISLNLGPTSVNNLRRYCRAHDCTAAQAIRALCTQAARPAFAVGSSASRRFTRTIRPARPRSAADLHFPSAHPASLDRKNTVARHSPTVCVALKLSVKLTAEACDGLRRIASIINGTHQDAIRHILGNLRFPGALVAQATPRNKDADD